MPGSYGKRLAARYSRGSAALWVAAGYAALVVGVTIFVVVDSLVSSGSLAAIWLFFVTLPMSLVVMLVLSLFALKGAALAIPYVLGGLLQAWVLWLVLRGSRVAKTGRVSADS
ncbi:SCO4225 family membrane protein [Amycolatopsis nigrescens]|uniref:SCO4225 family membrane protein n=1 Tax=Amycolatopsis nigrescens TaxID=381445 RepID=UPI000377CF1C|nr:hypothetical protein [Amycolatopsis nigrescens]